MIAFRRPFGPVLVLYPNDSARKSRNHRGGQHDSGSLLEDRRGRPPAGPVSPPEPYGSCNPFSGESQRDEGGAMSRLLTVS